MAKLIFKEDAIEALTKRLSKIKNITFKINSDLSVNIKGDIVLTTNPTFTINKLDGNIEISITTSLKTTTIPKVINGNLVLKCQSTWQINLPEIKGDCSLFIANTHSYDSTKIYCEKIGGNLFIANLQNIKSLANINYVGGNITLERNASQLKKTFKGVIKGEFIIDQKVEAEEKAALKAELKASKELEALKAIKQKKEADEQAIKKAKQEKLELLAKRAVEEAFFEFIDDEIIRISLVHYNHIKMIYSVNLDVTNKIDVFLILDKMKLIKFKFLESGFNISRFTLDENYVNLYLTKT
jgi:hypothetical protein